MHYENDLVMEDNKKILSMEFDWKRSPINPLDFEFIYKDKTYKRLSFDTKPLEDIEEFQQIRDAWERYTKKERKILKYMRDFEPFKIYVDTNKLPKDIAAYMSTVDGDLKRARMHLVTAFRENKAGFDKIKARYGKKLSLTGFAQILTDYGIPCKYSNVDNARKQLFQTNQVPRTERVKKSFEQMKLFHFPELEVHQLLCYEK